MGKTVLILTFVAAAIILASCENMESDNPVTINLDGSAKMRIAMHVNPELGIHSGEVTISKGDIVHSQPLEFDNGNASVIFSDLQPGIWLVDVELRDEDDYVLYQGSGEAGVVGGQTNTATIVLEELSGDLEVFITIPTDSIEPPDFSPDAVTLNFDDLPLGLLTDELAHLGVIFENTKVISWDAAPSPPNEIAAVHGGLPMRAIFVDPVTLELTVTTRVGMFVDLDIIQPAVTLVAYDASGTYIESVPFSGPGDFAGIEHLSGIGSVEIGPSEGYDDFIFEPITSSVPQPRIVFQSNRGGGTKVYAMNGDGSDVQRLTDDNGYDPDWSPDGTKIAFTRCCPFNIYTMNADGSEVQKITDTLDRDVFPEWSPDGSQIVFSRKHDGQWQIYLMDSNGSNQQNLSNNTWDDIYPAWSPDGTKIAFQTSRDGNAEIYLMNTDGSNQSRLTDNPAGDSVEAWSPDGAKLIFTTNRDGNLEIYSINSDGSDPINLTNHPADDLEATWSSDGLRIAFSSHRSGNQEIYVMQADGSDPINVTHTSASDSRPDWNVRSE